MKRMASKKNTSNQRKASSPAAPTKPDDGGGAMDRVATKTGRVAVGGQGLVSRDPHGLRFWDLR